MSRKKKSSVRKSARRQYTDEFKEEAVQLLLDGYTAPQVVDRLGISNVNVLYRWKQEQLEQSGPVASSLEAKVKDLEADMRRVERERDILKKNVGYFRPQRIADVYAAVEAIVQEGHGNVAAVCRYLGVNLTSFYAWQTAEPTVLEERDAQLAPLVRVIFKRHRRRYGARRIAEDLKEMGHHCDRRKVSNVMKTLKLKAIQPKSFVPKTTDSRHRLGYSPNLLLDADAPTTINQVWIGDITYIPLTDGTFCYMAMLMDLFSRRIVGWHLDDNMTEQIVLKALRSAIKERQPDVGLLHHTDRGGQYAGNEYRSLLRRAAITQSMSHADNCYDNAFMESCFGTIRNELEMTDYQSKPEARKEMSEYIRYYVYERRHSSLDYRSPAQFEQFIKLSK